MGAPVDSIAGRYRLGPEIGAGGMGSVHSGFDLRLHRDVAIKLLPPSALGDASARGRLIDEARACAALRHAGIVAVYDVGETDDGGAYLVMVLVRGRSLRGLLDDDTWDARARMRAVVEAARALGEAHRAGFVHRDVKPDNVMLRDDGHAVLLDFGIAKSGAAGVGALTGAGIVLGTPYYLSPEQALGRTLDGRSDQFSLAVTAYELLTRRMPWKAGSAVELIASILADTPAPLELAAP